MSPLSKKIVIILSLVVIAFVATGYVRARSNNEKAYRALTVYSEVLDKCRTIMWRTRTSSSDQRGAAWAAGFVGRGIGVLEPAGIQRFIKKRSNKAAGKRDWR